MVIGLIHKVIFSGLAATVAAGATLVTSASVTPTPAYGVSAAKLEAAAAATAAARIFDRADLDNNRFIDGDEYEILAVVTAELAQINGFIVIDAGQGVEIVTVVREEKRFLDSEDKTRVKERAQREFQLIAGDDERLSSDEFVTAQLEQFLAIDADRNGVLAGAELSSYAYAQSRLSSLSS